MSIFTSGRLVQ